MSVTITTKFDPGSIPSVIADLKTAESTSPYNVAQFIQKRAREMAPFRTGFLKESIDISKVADHVWRCAVGANYGGYVEYGTRHMSPQPFFTPAVEEARAYFAKDMTSRVKDACRAR